MMIAEESPARTTRVICWVTFSSKQLTKPLPQPRRPYLIKLRKTTRPLQTCSAQAVGNSARRLPHSSCLLAPIHLRLLVVPSRSNSSWPISSLQRRYNRTAWSWTIQAASRPMPIQSITTGCPSSLPRMEAATTLPPCLRSPCPLRHCHRRLEELILSTYSHSSNQGQALVSRHSRRNSRTCNIALPCNTSSCSPSPSPNKT